MVFGKATTRTRVTASVAIKVFFLVGSCLLATSTTAATTTSDTAVCADESTACFADDTCLECVTLSLGTTSFSECESELATDDTTVCGYKGIAYCCQSETSDTATCVNDEITLAYWTCIREADGCSLDDMPCVGAETPAPSTTESPTNSPAADEASGSVGGMVPPSRVLYAGVLGLVAVVRMMM